MKKNYCSLVLLFVLFVLMTVVACQYDINNIIEKADEVTVTFYDAAGNKKQIRKVPVSTTVTLTSEKIKRNGYTLTGWTETENSEEPEYSVGEEIEVNKDLFLYAVWQENRYSIEYYAEKGGEVLETKETDYTDVIEFYEIPQEDLSGKTLSGWNTEQGTAVEEGASVSTLYPDAENGSVIKLFARLVSPDQVLRIEFYPNNGVGNPDPEVQNFVKGEAEKALRSNSFVWKGHKFLGWATEETAAEPAYRDKQALSFGEDAEESEVKLYAVWAEVSYIEVKENPVSMSFEYGTAPDFTGLKIAVYYEGTEEPEYTAYNDEFSFTQTGSDVGDDVVLTLEYYGKYVAITGFGITPASVSLVWPESYLPVYNGQEVTVGQLLHIEGLHAGDVCEVTGSNLTGKNAGSYSAKVTGLTNPNYVLAADADTDFDWEIKPKVLYPELETSTLTYNGEEQSPEIGVRGLLEGDEYILSVEGYSAKDCGEYEAIIRPDKTNSNYILPEDGTVKLSWKILPKTVELVWTDPANLVYDGTEKKVSVALKAGSVYAGDVYEVVVGGGSAGTNAGAYTAEAVEKTANPNYCLPEEKTHSWTIEKAAGLAISGETLKGGDGEITGLASDKAYEYSLDKTTWTQVSNKTGITNLKAGKYYIRYAEDENHLASAEDKYSEVTVVKSFTVTADKVVAEKQQKLNPDISTGDVMGKYVFFADKPVYSDAECKTEITENNTGSGAYAYKAIPSGGVYSMGDKKYYVTEDTTVTVIFALNPISYTENSGSMFPYDPALPGKETMLNTWQILSYVDVFYGIASPSENQSEVIRPRGPVVNYGSAAVLAGDQTDASGNVWVLTKSETGWPAEFSMNLIGNIRKPFGRFLSAQWNANEVPQN